MSENTSNEAVMRPRILVDADACPVKEEIYRVAERYGAHVREVSKNNCSQFSVLVRHVCLLKDCYQTYKRNKANTNFQKISL